MAKKKSKKKGVKYWKKRAWDAFSKYIRLRDAIETTGTKETLLCCSCGKPYPAFGKGCAQAGHFVPGRTHSLLFRENGVSGQCLTSHSNLRMFNGRNKNISKIKSGDKLWGFDKDSFERKPSVVESVRSFIPKELFRVDLKDGSSFYATKDHQVVVNKKWIDIKNLLHNELTCDILEL